MLNITTRKNTKILLLEGVHRSAKAIFEESGFSNITEIKKALTKDELQKKIVNTDVIGIRSRTQLTAEILEEAKHLLAIGCFCIGTNQVDLDKAHIAGIPVFNAPHANTRSVAELVIGMTVMLMRQVFSFSTGLHNGEWNKTTSGSYELRGKNLGIIGYGHIGSQVSILAESFGMHVTYYDIEPKLPLGNAKAVVEIRNILEHCDVVTMHVPETPETKGMISKDQLKMMKKGSVLINASRGTVVNIQDLADSINSDHLKGAAIDVYPSEPASNDITFDSPLVGLRNVILTPHIGGSTIEAQKNIAIDVATKLSRFCTCGPTIGAVNFPQLNLRPRKNIQRILHIHRNVPGMLKSINHIVASKDINIVGQHLNTLDQIGYVVLDIDSKDKNGLVDDLHDIDGTIKTRVIG